MLNGIRRRAAARADIRPLKPARRVGRVDETAVYRPEPLCGAAVTSSTSFKDGIMSKNHHNPDSTDQALNQNNQMSDDPGDGSRKSFVTGPDGGKSAAEKAPEQDDQDQSTIEAFGEEGAGIAAKE